MPSQEQQEGPAISQTEQKQPHMRMKTFAQPVSPCPLLQSHAMFLSFRLPRIFRQPPSAVF